MRFMMRIGAVFGKIVHDGISSVPQVWFEREKNSPICKLLDLCMVNGGSAEVRKLPSPKWASDYLDTGNAPHPDPLKLNTLTEEILTLTGNYQVNFELNGVAIVDRMIPSLLGWAALKYESQLEIYPEENILFRIRPKISR